MPVGRSSGAAATAAAAERPANPARSAAASPIMPPAAGRRNPRRLLSRAIVPNPDQRPHPVPQGNAPPATTGTACRCTVLHDDERDQQFTQQPPPPDPRDRQ